MIQRISNYLQAGYSGLYVVSHEEGRVEEALISSVKTCNEGRPKNDPHNPPFQFFVWSLTEGVLEAKTGKKVGGQDDGVTGLFDWFEKADDFSVVLCRDFHLPVEDRNPFVWRRLRDLLKHGKSKNKTLVILGCRLTLPPELEKEVVVLDFSLPDTAALGAVLDRLVGDNAIPKTAVDERGPLLSAASGLTLTEAEQAFALSYVETKRISKEIVFREKCQAVRKNGLLEVVESKVTLDDIGGLENLKHWLVERRDAFGDEAKAFNLPSPKGALFVGQPGCLHPDTPVFDPVDGTTKTVKERHEEGLPFHVISASAAGPVVAAADAPFKYPEARMVTLRHSAGEITVTLGHRLLTSSGWLTSAECVSRFERGERVRLLTLDAGRRVSSLPDGLRWTQKVPGSLFGCSTDLRPCDGRLPKGGGGGLWQAPSPADAPGHIRGGSPQDGSGYTAGRSRPCLESGPLPTPGSSDRSGQSPRPIGGETSIPEKESSENTSQSRPAGDRNPDTSVQPRHGALPSTREGLSSGGSPASPAVSQPETISGAEGDLLGLRSELHCDGPSEGPPQFRKLFVRAGIRGLPETSVLEELFEPCGFYDGGADLWQVESAPVCAYYDFHVPLLENYWACGTFHHNTGKSLTAKACHSVFGVPLLRLDAGKLFGSLVGQSEGNWRAVHATAKAMAPCILWIDEVDGAMSGGANSGQTDGGTTARVIKSILQDMQDNSEGIFYALTANDVDNLPAPLLRRMDEVWNVELPTVGERETIWRIQIAKHKRKPEAFDCAALALKTEGYSGAEIEKLVTQMLYRGFAERREPTVDDGLALIETFSPLSKTMAADIEKRRTRLAGVAKLAGGVTKLSVPKPTRRIAAVGRN